MTDRVYTVADLRRLPMADTPTSSSRRIIQYCPRCEREFSAHPGDYWDAPDDTELRCSCDGQDDELTPVRLVTKGTVYTEVG